ncbi:MAG: response regulator transcription factor [Anaerolineae bacterium]
MAKILVVDDEPQMRDMIRMGLMEHEVILAGSGVDALLAAARHTPDLIVLDVKMPGMDGFETCRRLRADPELSGIPVIFATSQDTLSDKLEGFDAGADDYVIKPFDLTELQLRIRAVLRRIEPGKTEMTLQVGKIKLNLLSREVSDERGSVVLTPTEFSLLEYMMRRRGVLLPTSQMLEEVWDYPPGVGDPALVRMHIRNLREKLEEDPSTPKIIQTVGRQGYTIRE